MDGEGLLNEELPNCWECPKCYKGDEVEKGQVKKWFFFWLVVHSMLLLSNETNCCLRRGSIFHVAFMTGKVRLVQHLSFLIYLCVLRTICRKCKSVLANELWVLLRKIPASINEHKRDCALFIISRLLHSCVLWPSWNLVNYDILPGGRSASSY